MPWRRRPPARQRPRSPRSRAVGAGPFLGRGSRTLRQAPDAPPPAKPPPPNPAVQVFPPVDVLRTVVAVTAPVVLAGPNALTQSPTANAVDVVAWVSERVVVD